MCVQNGGTPLIGAAWFGYPAVCKLLLTAKAQPDLQDKVRGSSDDWEGA